MNKNKFLKLSLYTFIMFVFVMIVNYFFFHFVTDDGITTQWQPEAGKPFVADLIGVFGVLFLFTSVLSLFIAFIFYKEEGGKKYEKN